MCGYLIVLSEFVDLMLEKTQEKTRILPWVFYEILHNSYSVEHLGTPASEIRNG